MSTIKANTLLHSDGSTTNPPAIPALDTRMAKAWVNFNGDAFGVRSSYGVSSVTDLSTGLYRVNFSTAQPNINYCVVTSAGATYAINSSNAGDNRWPTSVQSMATTSVTTQTTFAQNGYNYQNNQHISLLILSL